VVTFVSALLPSDISHVPSEATGSPVNELVTGYGAPVSFIFVVIIMELPRPRFEYIPVCSSVHEATGVVASESFETRFKLSSTALDSVTAGGPNTIMTRSFRQYVDLGGRPVDRRQRPQ